MAEGSNPRKRKLCPLERQQAISKLYEGGGFVLVNETVVSVHQSEPGGCRWNVVDYGIPAVVATEERFVICIADAYTGVTVREFKIDSSSQYTALKDHFHVFSHQVPDSERSYFYGISFPDVSIAKMLLSIISELVSSDPLPKQGKQGEVEDTEFEDWVKIEWKDVPKTEEAEENGKGSGVDTAKGDGKDEEVDAPFRFGKKQKKQPRVLEISAPTDFKHISHVGSETSISKLSSAIEGKDLPLPAEGAESEAEITKMTSEPVESSAKHDLPSEAVKLPISSTPAVATTHSPKASPAKIQPPDTRIPPEPKIGVNIPGPPPLSDHEALLQEIVHFDRTKLRTVTMEDIARTKNMPDSQDEPLSLQSLLKSGLEKMREKLQGKFSRMATISGNDEEEGFDEFDGLLCAA